MTTRIAETLGRFRVSLDCSDNRQSTTFSLPSCGDLRGPMYKSDVLIIFRLEIAGLGSPPAPRYRTMQTLSNGQLRCSGKPTRGIDANKFELEQPAPTINRSFSRRMRTRR